MHLDNAQDWGIRWFKEKKRCSTLKILSRPHKLSLQVTIATPNSDCTQTLIKPQMCGLGGDQQGRLVSAPYRTGKLNWKMENLLPRRHAHVTGESVPAVSLEFGWEAHFLSPCASSSCGLGFSQHGGRVPRANVPKERAENALPFRPQFRKFHDIISAIPRSSRPSRGSAQIRKVDIDSTS